MDKKIQIPDYSGYDFFGDGNGIASDHAKVAYCLGDCYFNGNGVDKDDIKAEEFLRKSANADCPNAEKTLERYFGVKNEKVKND